MVAFCRVPSIASSCLEYARDYSRHANPVIIREAASIFWDEAKRLHAIPKKQDSLTVRI